MPAYRSPLEVHACGPPVRIASWMAAICPGVGVTFTRHGQLGQMFGDGRIGIGRACIVRWAVAHAVTAL